MLEQQGNGVRFYAFYTEDGEGKTGLTVTIDVYDPSGNLAINGANATERGGGLYYYDLASGQVDEAGEFAAIFKTASADVDQKHLPALWVVGRAGVEHLDRDISTAESNIRGSDSDTLETLSDQLDSVATSTELSTAESNIRGSDSDTLKTLSDQLDGVSTFDETTDTVDVGAVGGTVVSGPGDLKADVTSIATDITDILKRVRNTVGYSGTQMVVYDDDGTTPLFSYNMYDAAAALTSNPLKAVKLELAA